jgi:hypothetical protein
MAHIAEMSFSWQARREENALKIYAKWEDNIKMVLREIGLEGIDYIPLVQIGASERLLCGQ